MPRPITCSALLLVMIAGAASAQDEKIERGTRVVPERPGRVFVMAGFDDNCRPKTPVAITIDKAPGKGEVTFREGQTTTIQYSISGRCIGTRLTGTGIYYTARKGATGTDTFSITARIGSDTASRTFTVRIADD